MYKQDVM